jgi:cellulose synthase/poly-beta-1,6-N-acetylglucosamine synthase-like glycosyltransferase
MEEIMMIPGILMLLIGCMYAGLIGFFTFGWYRKKSLQSEATVKTATKVSVIVAARNEEKYITDLLTDLAGQHYPATLMEVLVIDDHSTDKTAGIVSEFIVRRDLHGFNLINPATVRATDGFTRQAGPDNEIKAGKKAAITAGISLSTGDLILLTDADCRVGPDWVQAMVSYFNDEKKMMVFGPVSYFPEEGLLNRFQSLEFSGLMASGAGAAMAGHPFMCNGANLAYRKEAFLTVGGYEGNEEFISGDDVFLMHKMKEEFGSQAIGFAKDIKTLVQTYPAPGLKAFFRQRIRWASKTRGYRDMLAILTAAMVFCFNFLILSSFFAGFYYPQLFLIYAAAILLKALIDLPIMLGVTGFNSARSLMIWYLPFQVVYPFYVVVAGILSLFRNKQW